MMLEIEDEWIERLETGRPSVRLEVKAMSLVASASEKKPYGVERVCKAWQMSSSTVYRMDDASAAPSPRRRTRCRHAWLKQGHPQHIKGADLAARARKQRLARQVRSRTDLHSPPRSHDGTIIPVDRSMGYGAAT